MVSSALGKALGLTEESTLEELKNKIVSVENKGTLDFNPSNSTSQSVSAGYYTGGIIASSNAYNAGVNSARNGVGVITKQINRTTWDSGNTWYTIGTIPANKKVYVCAAPWNTSGGSATQNTRLQFSHGNTSVLSGPSYYGGAFIFNFSTSSAITFKCRLWSNYYDGDGESVKLLIVYW